MAFHSTNEHASVANNYAGTSATGQKVSGITAGLQALPRGTNPQPGGYSLCTRCEQPVHAIAQILTPPEGPVGILAPDQTTKLCSRCASKMEVNLAAEARHAATQKQPCLGLSRAGLAALQTAEPITASYLARYHLPRILEPHLSMPIRDIMNQLVLTVPGFSAIENNKARRLTVAALEHRDGGGINGEVKFEKIGWGRWRIGRPGQTGAQAQPVPISSQNTHSYTGPTPPTSLESNGNSMPVHSRLGHSGFAHAGSYALSFRDTFAGSSPHPQSDSECDSDADTDMDDADAMSIDEGDQTDEEDWSNLGPEVRRMLKSDRELPSENRNYNLLSMKWRHRSPLPALGQAAHSAPLGRTVPMAQGQQQYCGSSGFATMHGAGRSASEEENAAELLLSLRSQ